MSEEMFNDAIYVDVNHTDAVFCINGTGNLCINATIHTFEAEFDEDLIVNCRYYLEGIALTPISVFGMLGKSFS